MYRKGDDLMQMETVPVKEIRAEMENREEKM